MKELEAKWLVSAYDYFKSTKAIIQTGFKISELQMHLKNGGQYVVDKDPFTDID